MFQKKDAVDQVAERVIASAIEVHRTMGPGLLESIYQECLLIELLGDGLGVECERMIGVDYKGQRLSARFFIDLVVERCVVVEVKAIEAIKPVHKAQVISYLKLSGLPAGLLINFNETTLTAGLSRLEHPERYAKRRADRGPL